MESDKKNNSNRGEEHQQLRRSARTQKRKLNELANDDHGQPAAAEEEQQQPGEKYRKNKHGKKQNYRTFKIHFNFSYKGTSIGRALARRPDQLGQKANGRPN
jgi:hypothetical protein